MNCRFHNEDPCPICSGMDTYIASDGEITPDSPPHVVTDGEKVDIANEDLSENKGVLQVQKEEGGRS